MRTWTVGNFSIMRYFDWENFNKLSHFEQLVSCQFCTKMLKTFVVTTFIVAKIPHFKYRGPQKYVFSK